MQSSQTIEGSEVAATKLRLAGLGRQALPWALFAIALVAAGVFAYLWQSAIGSEAAASELRSEARMFVSALTTFSSETIEGDVKEIRSYAAGTFTEEVDELFGTETIAAIKKAEATSTGRVEEIFVQDMNEDSASVFAVVNEEITNKNTTEPRTEVVRMEVGLVKVADRWKIDRVELFQTQANP